VARLLNFEQDEKQKQPHSHANGVEMT
jgi:hypothetical protein